MAGLIDASSVIDLERRGRSPEDLARLAPGGPIALASVTVSELLVGVHRAAPSERRTRRQAFVELVLALTPILPFDLAAARVHARLWADLAGTGQQIGHNDLLIAATALANGYDVLTLNLRDFGRVPGPIVRQPTW